MTRVAQITSEIGLSAPQREAWDAIKKTRGVVRGPFSVLLHSPMLAVRTADLGTVVRFESHLPRDVRLVLCLITARHFDCQFEWSSNEADARSAGVHDGVIAAIRDRLAPAGLNRDEAMLFAFADELLTRNRISADTYERALQRFGTRDLVELVGCIAYYANLAMTLNAFEVASGPYFTDLLPIT